jgi:hypothetical protein
LQQGLLSDKDDREYDRIVKSVNVVEEAHEHPSQAGDIIRRVNEFKGWDEFLREKVHVSKLWVP